MTSPTDTIALLAAAGTGSRAGGAVAKQYALLAGKPMIAHAYDALAGHPAIGRVVVVVAPGADELLRGALGDVVHVPGGATRRESVRLGLEACDGADRVLVHDAARPLVPAPVIDRVLGALDEYDGAVPVLPVADTLAHGAALLGEMVPRAGLVRIQTPQGFRLASLRAAHAAWPADEDATDDAQMVRRLGGAVALVQGDAMLDKVTHPEDFAEAERRIGRESRTATGFDVHRLEDGEELWLGGVLIPHHQGLSGHSDADVALHALTDALLGTVAAGDIGTHFPPSDPQWRGAESGQFLRHAAGLVRAQDGRIDFVDLTLICEAPRIGPHRAAIRARVAELLELPADRVSVKATTSEGLGFTGRGARMLTPLAGRRRWWVAVPVSVAAVLVAQAVLGLPFSVLAQHADRVYDLSRQAWGPWAVDQVKGLLVSWVATSLVVLVVVWCARRSPRWWFAWAGAAAVLLTGVGSFLYPVVVEPLFNSFTPMRAGALRTSIFTLADREGVHIDDVLVADASRRTTTLNAYVSGYGSTRRVVVYDNTLRELSPAEVRVVVAHELGHARNDDVLLGTGLGAVGAVGGVAVLGLLLDSERVRRRSGVSGPADPRVVPLALALVAVGTFAVSPVQNTVSRAIEARADRVSIQTTHADATFVRMQRRLALSSLADPDPPALSQLWWGTHPTVLERAGLPASLARAGDG